MRRVHERAVLLTTVPMCDIFKMYAQDVSALAHIGLDMHKGVERLLKQTMEHVPISPVIAVSDELSVAMDAIYEGQYSIHEFIYSFLTEVMTRITSTFAFLDLSEYQMDNVNIQRWTRDSLVIEVPL